jgi:hypothetical protein
MGKLTIAEESLSTPSAGFGRGGFDPSNKMWLQKLSTGNFSGDQFISRVTQIASHSADTYYQGIQLPQFGLQAGMSLEWLFDATKGAAGTATPVYQIRFGPNQSTADTSRLSITGPAQTAAADVARIHVLVTVRVAGAAAILRGFVHLQHNLAATGFANTPAGFSLVGATSAAFDASAIQGQYVGLSVNPGTSGAWVIEQVHARARF